MCARGNMALLAEEQKVAKVAATETWRWIAGVWWVGDDCFESGILLCHCLEKKEPSKSERKGNSLKEQIQRLLKPCPPDEKVADSHFQEGRYSLPGPKTISAGKWTLTNNKSSHSFIKARNWRLTTKSSQGMTD